MFAMGNAECGKSRSCRTQAEGGRETAIRELVGPPPSLVGASMLDAYAVGRSKRSRTASIASSRVLIAPSIC